MHPQNEIDMEYVYRLIVKENKTIRQAAEKYGISKTSLHIHIHKDMPLVSIDHYLDVLDIFKKNSKEKHLRGGIATKKKFGKMEE